MLLSAKPMSPKPRPWILAILFTFAVACTVYDGPETKPNYGSDIRIEVFYDSLSPYGDWVLLDTHGWGWLPRGVGLGWRPYTHGSWIHTAFGWTWHSDWAWGWAPFHYGRWTHHDHHGWVWIPGRRWAPAWVAWRAGDGYFGWAPLPASVGWRAGVGLELGSVDLDLAVGSSQWVFVADRYLINHDLRDRLEPRNRHAALIRGTRNVTRYHNEGNSVVDRGITPERVERVLGHSVPRYRIKDLDAPPGRPSALEREALRVYRPKVSNDKAKRPPARGTSEGRKGKGEGEGKGEGNGSERR